VTFSGSHEALFFGHDKPDFNPGDKVKITFERIISAIPITTPIE
jgi:hypothetical protein